MVINQSDMGTMLFREKKKKWAKSEFTMSPLSRPTNATYICSFPLKTQH